jgi:HPt (histidine-containing phosphotransfer) domain-containing protein
MLQRCNNKAALAIAVLGKFQAQGQQAAINLDRHLADRDWEGIARVAHALKGTAGVICAESMRSDAARVEAIARDNGSESLPGAVAALRASLVAAMASAAEVAQELAVPPTRATG